MDGVARWSEADRRDLFTQSAANLGFGSPLIMEKDFWVCWALRHAVGDTGARGVLERRGR